MTEKAVEENTPLYKFGPMIVGGVFRYLSDVMVSKCKNSIELKIDEKVDNFDFGASSDILISLFNQGYESTLLFF